MAYKEDERDTPAGKLEVGDRLPGFLPQMPAQTVRKIEHLTGGMLRITTDGAFIDGQAPVWTISRWEILHMPSRLDLSTVEWATNPIPEELRSGDTIRDEHGQPYRVIRLQRIGGQNPNDICLVTLKDPGQMYTQQIKRWRVKSFTPIGDVWDPDNTTGHHATPEETVSRLDNPHGPYVYGRHTYFLYQHPYGRGRWPSDIPEFELTEEEGETKCRPPRDNIDWHRMGYVGEVGQRHPKDPVEMQKKYAERRLGLGIPKRNGAKYNKRPR